MRYYETPQPAPLLYRLSHPHENLWQKILRLQQRALLYETVYAQKSMTSESAISSPISRRQKIIASVSNIMREQGIPSANFTDQEYRSCISHSDRLMINELTLAISLARLQSATIDALFAIVKEMEWEDPMTRLTTGSLLLECIQDYQTLLARIPTF